MLAGGGVFLGSRGFRQFAASVRSNMIGITNRAQASRHELAAVVMASMGL
jgi:uncharacterized membrane protein